MSDPITFGGPGYNWCGKHIRNFIKDKENCVMLPRNDSNIIMPIKVEPNRQYKIRIIASKTGPSNINISIGFLGNVKDEIITIMRSKTQEYFITLDSSNVPKDSTAFIKLSRADNISGCVFIHTVTAELIAETSDIINCKQAVDTKSTTEDIISDSKNTNPLQVQIIAPTTIFVNGIKSFDFWDTLIARRSITDIYNEENNIFPIAENVSKVGARDIIVSDYYSEDNVKILSKEICGLKNKCYVTNGGKYFGTIWSTIRGDGYNPIEHYGDDIVSDVKSANNAGIQGVLTKLSQFTDMEKKLGECGLSGLARTMRETRLVTWNNKYRNLQIAQIQFNFPMLFIASIILHRTNPDKLLMCARDCCLWKEVQQLVKSLCGGEYDIVYFKTSRLASYYFRPGYDEYIKSLLPGTVVDMCASGDSLMKLREKSGVDFPIAILGWYDFGFKPNNISRLTRARLKDSYLEFMNFDNTSVFISHEEQENPMNIDWNMPEILVQHETFMKCLDISKNYDFSQDIKISDETLQKAFSMCFDEFNKCASNTIEFHQSFFWKENSDIMNKRDNIKKIEEIKQMIAKIGSLGMKDGSSIDGYIYHPIPFPEFNNLPTYKSDAATDEYMWIKNDYGSFANKNVLDIGCANGYFAFNIAAGNAERVVGYEGDELVYDVNEAIKKYKNIQNVSFINKYFNISEAKAFKDKEFDVVLMLNVHMWIRKQLGKDATIELMKIMSKKTNVIYFETVHNESDGAYKVPELESLDDIKQYLVMCGFKNIRVLGRDEKWGNRFIIKADGDSVAPGPNV